MKTVFKKVTESPETLAEYLSSESKDNNKGCSDCEYRNKCTGKETCKAAWMKALISEV